jgi:putative phage-type endonuclease
MPALTPANDLVRARNITASEVGALLDKHPYSTPLSIYNRLMSIIPDERPNQSQAMALGVFLESRIARYAAKHLGLKIRAGRLTVEHPDVALCATPDYYVVGQRMLLEIKLSSKLYVWTDETLQPYIEWQARAQMACTNRDSVIVAALVGSAFYTVIVVRDAAKEARLIKAVDEFWQNHIMLEIPPSIEQMRLSTVTVEGK